MKYLLILSIVWLVSEFSLVIRDRAQGKGKIEKDRGTRNYNLFSIIVSDLGLSCCDSGVWVMQLCISNRDFIVSI